MLSDFRLIRFRSQQNPVSLNTIQPQFVMKIYHCDKTYYCAFIGLKGGAKGEERGGDR